MIAPQISQGRALASRIVLAQCVVTLMISLQCALLAGADALISALLGGLAALIPQALFSIYAFAWSGAQRSHQVMGAFYRGEALKMASAVIIMWVAIAYVTVQPLAFFSAYISGLATVWVVPLVWQLKVNKK